jgi:hypothetical protein
VKTRFAFVCAAIVAAALAACGGGGGGGSSPIPHETQTQPPTVTATLGSSPSSVSIPGSTGASGSILLPAGSGTLVITGSATAPSPVPTVFLESNSGRRFAVGGNTAVVYVTLTASGGPVSMNGLPGVKVKLPSDSPSGTYFVAYYSNGQQPAWASTTTSGSNGGPGSTIDIPVSSLISLTTLGSGQSIYLALYAGDYIPPINVFGCVGTPSPAPPVIDSRLRAALVGSHPITSGDAYNYTGSMSQTITRSLPCPQPTATANATVTIAVSMSPDPSIAGYTDENSLETDSYALGTAYEKTTAVVTSQNGDYYELQETTSDGPPGVTPPEDTLVTTYATPGAEYAQTTATGWTDGLPQTFDQKQADGTTLNRTYGANGTFYTETDTIPGNGTNIITADANGSGTYEIGHGTSADILISIGAPSGNAISFAVKLDGIALGSPLSVPVWYTMPLYSDATVVVGPNAPSPSACSAVVANFGSTDELKRTILLQDPILGYTETEVVTTWDVPNYNNGTTTVTLGPVCAQITDTLSTFYDYSLTTPSLAFLSASPQQPLIVNTIDETLALQSSGLVANDRARAMSASLQLAAQIAAVESSIRFTRALERANLAKTIANAARMRAFLGGVK